MSPQPKRPEDEAPEAETPAASETSGATSPAESAAAEPTPDTESTTAPAGDPVAEEALGDDDAPVEVTESIGDETVPPPADEDEPAVAAPAETADEPAEDETAAKAVAEQPEPPADDTPAAPAATPAKPTPAPRRRDLPREPGETVVVRASAKYVRSSARKARLVCDNIRGKSVADAKSILAFHPRHVAEAWEKLLDSAVANAENNHELEADELKILAIYADEGPTIKRFRPRAHGRATQIRKRTSHLSIQLTTKD